MAPKMVRRNLRAATFLAPFFATFSEGRLFDAFGPPFGSLLAPCGSLWLPLGSLWLPFGSLWHLVATFWLQVGLFWGPFGSILIAWEVAFFTVGSPLVSFLCFSQTSDENMIKHQVSSLFVSEILFLLAPKPAKPLQITVCTLTFARHTIFQGPERVHCRRQLRSAPGRRRPRRVGIAFVLCSLFLHRCFSLLFFLFVCCFSVLFPS